MAIKLTFTEVSFDEHNNGSLVGHLSHSSKYLELYPLIFNLVSFFNSLINIVKAKKTPFVL